MLLFLEDSIMNSGWRGIISSWLFSLLVLTTVSFLRVESAVIPTLPGSKSSVIIPPKGGFLNYCWSRGQKDWQIKPHPVLEIIITAGARSRIWVNKYIDYDIHWSCSLVVINSTRKLPIIIYISIHLLKLMFWLW